LRPAKQHLLPRRGDTFGVRISAPQVSAVRPRAIVIERQGSRFRPARRQGSRISIIDSKSDAPGDRDPHHPNFDHLVAGSKALKKHGHKAVVDHPSDHGTAEAVRGQERVRRAVCGRRRCEEGECAMMLGSQTHSRDTRPLVSGFENRRPTARSLGMAQSLHNRYDVKANRDGEAMVSNGSHGWISNHIGEDLVFRAHVDMGTTRDCC
jgi:hypothetical protein